MSKIYRLIGHKPLGLSISFMVLQQAIIATSTWTIAHIGKKVASHQPITYDITIYCTLLLIVHLASIPSMIYLQKAQIKAWHTYLQKLSKRIYGKAGYYIAKEDEDKLVPWINGQAQQTLEEAIMHLYILIFTFLNALLNALIIMLTVSHNLLIAYTLSILICLIGVLISRQYIQRATKARITAETNLRATLVHLWDNMILGNVLNKLQWHNLFNIRYRTFSNNKITLAKKTRIISSLIMILAMTPIIITILLLAKKSSPVILGALLVTLPRQIQIIHNLERTVSGIVKWREHTTNLVYLYDTLHTRPSKVPVDYITTSHITLNDKPLASIQLDELVKRQTGRFTIRGKNGSGKSSLLLHLKLLLQDQAHLLPVDNKHMYYEHTPLSLSTGERTLATLQELKASQVPIILLDEWDANLDSKNLILMHTLIDDLAKKKLVIEARHSTS